MNSSTHPTMDILFDYIEKPGAPDFIDLRSHLLSCKQCRHKVNNLSSLSDNIHRDGGHLQFAKSDQLNQALNSNKIEQYVDGELDDAGRTEIQGLLEQDPQALKAALHYASHSSAMQNAGIPGKDRIPSHSSSIQNRTETLQSGNPSVMKDIINKLGGLIAARPPVWISATATAGVVFALVILLQPQGIMPLKQLKVATYQDQNVVHFQPADQPKGIGFFSKARRVTKPFAAVQIQISDNGQLHIKWPKIENARTYQLTIKLVNNIETVTVAEQAINTNQAIIDNFKPAMGKRYEWALHGETTDAKTFFTSGGFVIN